MTTAQIDREFVLRMKGVFRGHLDELEKQSAKEKRKLQIGNTARSRKMVKIIRETQTAMRLVFSKYLSLLNRVIAQQAKQVKVKRLRLKKYFNADRSMAYTGAEDDQLEDAFVIDEAARPALKENTDKIFDALNEDLMRVIAEGQRLAFDMAIKDIDKKPTGEDHNHEHGEQEREALEREQRQEREYLAGFLTSLRQKYKAVIDGDVEYTGNGYVFESPEEVGDVLRGIGEGAATRLDLHGMASTESAMVTGLVASGLGAGYVGGVWHTLHDGNVCPDCRALDGRWMSMEQFKENYKNTLCDGNCRCGEQFEPSNDVRRAQYGVF